MDDAKDIFANYLPTTRVEHIHGKATIQAVFEINNSTERAKIAGLRVTSGAMHREKVTGVIGNPFGTQKEKDAVNQALADILDGKG